MSKELNLFKEYKETKEIEKKQEIKNLLYSKYEGLIKYVCSSIVGSYDQDAYQEGALELLKCIDRFDYTKEVKFKTYAYSCLKKFMKRYKSTNINYDGRLSERKSKKLSELKQKEYLLSIKDDNTKEFTEEERIEYYKLNNFSNVCNINKVINEEGESLSILEKIDVLNYNIESNIILDDILDGLLDFEIKIINKVIYGKNVNEICNELKISRRKYFNIMKEIKYKILKKSKEWL